MSIKSSNHTQNSCFCICCYYLVILYSFRNLCGN
ncbi:hypothetical protein E2C01_048664 [Portunus trituberculatus]|uniref:Uncharacterized protein n=1 Tax=Portunus trituberculatus TaxID=210409 RepID=A0A5B7GAT1_PORTR|nr:hypothetical protein [Portunus trituberculatus]